MTKVISTLKFDSFLQIDVLKKDCLIVIGYDIYDILIGHKSMCIYSIFDWLATIVCSGILLVDYS